MTRIASMTGFAVAQRATALGTVGVELRSVNSRFLDLNLRLADDLRAVEPAIRERLSSRIARGKFDCRIGLQRRVEVAAQTLNAAVLAQLRRLDDEVRTAIPQVANLTVADVLAWPGVVDGAAADTEAVQRELLTALDEAIEALQATRGREGDALRRAVLERCDTIEAIAAQVRARVPELRAALERKLFERLDQSLASALASAGGLTRDDVAERIRQEVTLYGLRADVDEELSRLATHVTEVRRVLAAGGAVGRRLDFLMQELNREANTLGSKATAIELTNAAVELKIAIEQMREQIQNLE
ncbi:MAG TPA: YicC/YloC family endoribonuclease [Burkholderiaceae bacterium]|nr:YicC/YloC family endoribonuclease [Burkholderiaceae bacterium]